jgi:predicted phosphodiesterase
MIKKVVIAGDIHLPNHCPKAVSTFFNFLKSFKPDEVVLNGDFLDLKDISRHADASAEGRIKDDLKVANLFLDDLRKVVGSRCKIHLNMGNHDAVRYDRFVLQNAPQLEGLNSLQEMLQLTKRKITHMDYKPDSMHWLSNKLGVIHGFAYGKHHASATLDKVGVSVITSHHHRPQTHMTSTINKKGQSVRGCFGIGCLCPLEDVPYMVAPSGWVNGFGVALIDTSNDNFSVYQLNMIEHKLIAPNGKVYKPTGKGWVGK